MSEYRHVVRKWVKPEDLNQHGALFGGRLLQWVDEEAAIVAVTQLGTIDVVTRHMSAIDFAARADRGDLLELEYRVEAFGRTSITLSCRVENAVTGQEVLTLDRIVFVSVDAEGRTVPHGRTRTTDGTERLRGEGPVGARGQTPDGALARTGTGSGAVAGAVAGSGSVAADPAEASPGAAR